MTFGTDDKSQVSYNKNPTVWLDGAGPPPKYIFKSDVSLTNSKIQPTQILQSRRILKRLQSKYLTIKIQDAI